VGGRSARIESALWLVVLEPFLDSERCIEKTKEGGENLIRTAIRVYKKNLILSRSAETRSLDRAVGEAALVRERF
jgi:hypothetical protein